MLPRTPEPRPTESLLGYVLRVSETNGYDTPWHVLSYAGFSQREMKTAGFPVEKLAAVIGREASTLAGIAYCSGDTRDRHFKILGHSLGAGMSQGWLRLTKPAFCPKCVHEVGYLDAFWDLSQAVACPTHGCCLINSCPACGMKLRWYRPGLLVCRCEAELAGVTSVPADELLIQLMAVMRAKLHGTAIAELPNRAGFPLKAISRMSFNAFLSMTNRLGAFGLLSHGQTSKHDMHAVMEQAAGILADWPRGYHEFLGRLGTILKQKRPNAIGLRKQFERFYHPMFKDGIFASEMTFLRDEFVNFGSNGWGQAIVDRRLLNNCTEPRSKFQSFTRMASDIGVRPVTLKRWADRGLVPITAIGTKRPRYVIDKEAAALSRQTTGAIFETRRAAAYVNLPVSVLVGLKQSGHYAIDNWPRHKHGFHQADLDAIRRRILERATFVEVISSDIPVVSLQYILQEVPFWSKSGKAGFVAAYLDGRIDAVGRTGEIFAEVFFRKADVDTHAEACRIAVYGDAVSQQDAAAQLGCGLDVVASLLERDHLVRHQRRTGIRVETKSITLFTTTYISLAQLARNKGTQAPHLARLCMSLGIEMLSAARRNGSSVAHFIRRTDVQSLLAHFQPRPQKSFSGHISEKALPKLRRYLEDLRSSGAPLPRRAGQPNRAAISAACGFDRNVLYVNDEAAALLNRFDDEDRQIHKVLTRERPTALLRRYIEKMRQTGISLPRRAGQLNRVELARACGFRRDYFYSDPDARALLASIESICLDEAKTNLLV